MWHESEADRELAALKRQKLNLDSLLANEQSITIQLTTELKDLKIAHREDVHRLQQETDRALKAEEALRRKTEEYKLSEVQKANSETALLTAQRLLKEESTEVKRLNYELEVGSSRSFGNGAAQTRLVAEKAALEQRCAQLVEELSKSDSALERERANGSTNAFGGEDRQKTSNLNAKVIDLENRLTALQSENSRLSTKSSRTSIAPSDPAPSRNRFGYKSRPSISDLPPPAPTPARPSQLPLRRSSSVSGLPGTTIDASRVVQLEREVADGRSRTEGMEKELVGVRTKLATKERELLKVENQLMALERASSDEGERLKGKLGDAFEELESARAEVGRVKESMRGEYERLVKDGAERRGDLESKMERMRAALEKKEEEVERAEGRMEEVEMALQMAKEEDRAARMKGIKAVESVLAEKAEVERILVGVRQELKVEHGKEGLRERMEEELAGTKSALEELRTKTTRAIDEMSADKERIGRELELANVELKVERGRVESAEMEMEKAEERIAQAEEARVKAEKAVAEGLKPVDDARWEVEISSLKEKLEKAGEELRSSKTEYAILQNEMGALRTQHEAVDSSLIQLRTDLATKEADLTQLASHLAISTSSHATELAAAVASLAQTEAAKEGLEKERASLLSLLEVAEESIAKLQEEQQGATTASAKTAELGQERDGLAEALKVAEDKVVVLDQQRATAVAALAGIEEERDALVESLKVVEEKVAALEEERTTLAQVVVAKELLEQQREALVANLKSAEERISLLETERDDVATSMESLPERSSALASERDDLAELVKSSEDRIQALEVSIVDLAAANVALDVLRTEKAEFERVAAEHEQELVDLDGALQESEAKVVELESSLAAAASRSFDDAQVEDLRTALADSEGVVEGLRMRIVEVESLEWGASEGRKLAETEVGALQIKVVELQATFEGLVDSSHGDALKAQSDLSASRQAVEEAESRVALLEDRLSEATQARGDLEQQVHHLGGQVDEFEPTLARLVILEDDLRLVTAELEALRQTAEDSSIAALQESGAFQGRIAEQEAQIQDLSKELSAVEELRANLAIAEARVQTLDWELLEAQNQTTSSSRESTRHLAALTTRAEYAEEDVHRLQSELESANLRVADVENSLAQLRSSDNRPSSTPGSPTTAANPDASRQVVLVARLREERDELRSRLQFTRTEAQFRYEALQEQLHDVEEEKVREVTDLQVRLAQHAESIAAKEEVQTRAGVALDESREEALRLTADVEDARQALVAAESRIAEFETMADDSAALSREYDAVLAQVEELEDRLEATTSDAELIRSQLAIVRTDNEELNAALADLEVELEQASEETSRHRQLAAEASAALELTTEQCRLAELALAEAEKDLVVRAATLPSPLDLAPQQSLVDDLQEKVSALEAKVLRRTEQIGQHEQTIAILTTQLAAAAPLDDDDDTAEIEQPAVRADLEAELMLRSTQLEAEVDRRRVVESELDTVTADLGQAQQELASATSDVAAPQAQLDESFQSEGSALADAQAAFEAAESRHASLQGEYDALRVAIDELKASQDDTTQQQSNDIERLAAEVELNKSLYHDALDKVATLEAEVEEQSLQRASGTESSTANLELAAEREVELADRLASASSDLDAAQDKVAGLQRALEDAESQIDPLHSEISSLQEQITQRSAALDASLQDVSSLQASYDQLSTEFDALAASHADLDSSHAAEVARLSTDLERLVEERAAQNADLAQLENELAGKEARAAELESMYEEVNVTLETSERAVSDLSTRLSATEHDVFEARQAADSIAASLAELKAQGAEGLEIRERLEAEIRELDSLYQAASTDLDQASAANEGSEQRIVELEEHLGRLESELVEAKEALDNSGHAVREDLEELSSLATRLQDDKEQLVADLAASRDQLVGLQAQVADVEQTGAQLGEVEQLLEQAREEAAKLEETLQLERATVTKAKAVAEELASREIQTLRRLARTADGEVEALKQDRRALESLLQESEGLAAVHQQEMLHLQAEKESQVQEVLLHLESLEGEKADADARIVSLEEQLVERDAAASAASAALRSSQEAVERVKELEKRLEEKSIEVEETDEKYIEVLRTQKRHLGQIERLRVKIESLQRDLVAVKEVAPAPPAVSTAPIEPSSVGKKRTRPVEFDPAPSAPIPPRAVVATVSRTPKSLPIAPPPSISQDENATRLRSPIKRRTSKKEVVKAADGFVPLKPEGVSLPTERKALAPVGTNSALSAAPAAAAAAEKTKVAELRARLARMKGKAATVQAGEGTA